MARRVQTPQVAPAVAPRATAAPVDTFAQQTGARKLAQLSQGLAEFYPAAQRFSETYLKRKAAEDQAAGEAEARRLGQEGQSLADLTREGKLPRQNNPWFQAGLREQYGRVAADTWASDFEHFLKNDDVMKTTTDMETFDRIAKKKSQEFLKEKVGDSLEPNFQRGFGGRYDARYAQLRSDFADKVDKRLTQQADNAEFSEAHRHIREYTGKRKPEEIAAGLLRIKTDAINRGRTLGETNRVLVKAIAAAALESDDKNMETLKLLDHVPDGQGGTLGDQPFGAEARQDTIKEIVTTVRARQRELRQMEEDERRERRRKVAGEFASALVSKRRVDIKELAPFIKDDPDMLNDIRAIQENLKTLANDSDADVFRDLHARIWAKDPSERMVDEGEIIKAVRNRFLSPRDSEDLLNQLRVVNSGSEGGAEAAIWKDHNYKQEEQAIKQMFGGELIQGSDEARRAKNARAQFAESWYLLNKSGQADKMSPDAKIRWMQEEGERIYAQQKGKGSISVFKPVPPTFQGNADEVRKRQPQEAVLPENDLVDVLNGSISPAMHQKLLGFGVDSQQSLGIFLDTQSRLFQEKTGRAPKKQTTTTATEPKKE